MFQFRCRGKNFLLAFPDNDHYECRSVAPGPLALSRFHQEFDACPQLSETRGRRPDKEGI